MDTRALAHELRLRYQEEILRVMQDLVRIPSQNTPPVGEELACQEYIARYLGRLGLAPDVYEPDQVPGLIDHPSYWPGRQYGGRPNVSARLAGLGGGHSLLLTGHADTVVLGESPWTKDPFGGEIADGKLYGLGSIDMKGPLGAVLVMVRALVEQQVPLRGDLAFESVVDEEEGGVNATIAGRLRHGPMDGAVIPECTDLKIYPAARGVLVTNFIFTSTAGTWLQVGTSDQKAADAVEQMGYFLTHLDELRATRRAVPVPPLYLSYPDPVPVQVTKIYAGGWGPRVPIVVPPEGRIELIVQTIPGEQRADVLGQQVEWLESVIARYPDVFITHPEMKFRLRWLPPTSMDPAHPLVQTCIHSVAEVMGREPDVLGAPYACDMFALQQDFRMPALLFGPAGANAHSADEYIDIENLFTWWESLLVFVLKWCETDG